MHRLGSIEEDILSSYTKVDLLREVILHVPLEGSVSDIPTAKERGETTHRFVGSSELEDGIGWRQRDGGECICEGKK